MIKRVLDALLCFIAGVFPSIVLLMIYVGFFGFIPLDICAYITGSIMLFFGIFGFLKPKLAVKILFPFSLFSPF